MGIALPTQAQVEDVVNKYYSVPSNVGIMIGIAAPSAGPATGLYPIGGLVDYQGQPMALDESTPFQLASNTKIFTATLLAGFQDNDPSYWDKTINQAQPRGCPPLPYEVSLLDLARYVSGFPQDNDSIGVTMPSAIPFPYTLPGMYGYLHLEPFTPVGTGQEFTYSNLGYALLASSMEAFYTARTPFRELVHDGVFEPLGMGHTRWFGGVPFNEFPLAFSGGDSVSLNTWQDPAYGGSCGVVSNATDMMAWLLAHMGASGTLSPAILQIMQNNWITPPNLAPEQTGIGWFLDGIPAPSAPGGSVDVVWKDGGLDSCNSLVEFAQSPDPGTTPSPAGVFFLMNTFAPQPMYQIVDELILVTLGYEPPTVPSPSARRRAGTLPSVLRPRVVAGS